jgi:endogenous inhibitor of DNA gyrase (YacG/DUF329 family)
MARWTLSCPECNKDFTHSQIVSSETNALRNPFVFEEKPLFPTGGQSIECPNCKKSSTYQRHQLIYRAG